MSRHTVVASSAEVGAVLGNFTSVAEDVYVHHGDNHAVVANPDLVSTYSFGGWVPTYPSDGRSKGTVIIDHDVWIGRKVQILTGVHIYSGAIVAAHSVVTKDVPPYAVVAGNPAQIKKFRFSPEVIQSLLTIAWWNWEDDVIKARLPDMLDVNEFIKKYGGEG